MQKDTIRKVLDHFLRTYSDEFVLAMREFFDDESISSGSKLTIQDDKEEGLFMEWLVFDYQMQNGKKLLNNFIAENPFNLSKSELQVYEDLQMNKYGFYEILSVKKDQYIELESLQSGKIYKVLEKSATHNTTPKTTLMCRVGKVGNHFELIGSDPIGWPVYHTERLKKMMRKDKSRLSPKDARKMLIEKDDKPSEFEKSLSMSAEELKRKRNEIKRRLVKQLSKVKSRTTADDILAMIYREKGRAGDNMLMIASRLAGASAMPTQKIIDLVSSVWNHFPHKSLNGLSPAEKAQEVYNAQGREGFNAKKELDVTRVSESGLPVGAFLPLSAVVPELDEQETKSVTLADNWYNLEPGTYRLVENFCAERRCDCRKVMINLVDEKNKIIATIGFGWEGVKYYEKWTEDKKLAQQMTGAYLELTGIQTEHSRECLKLVKKILKDPYYVNCLRRHYKQFKASL